MQSGTNILVVIYYFFAQDGFIYMPVIFDIGAIRMRHRRIQSLFLINIKLIIYDQVNNNNADKTPKLFLSIQI